MDEFFYALRKLGAWLAAIAVCLLVVRFVLAPIADGLLATPGGAMVVALVVFVLFRRLIKWRP